MSSARLKARWKTIPGFVHTPWLTPRNPPKGSLTEVSRRAGVSIATASRVLNRSSHPVADGTRERVLARRPRSSATRPAPWRPALVTQRSRIIGVIVGDIVDPYFAEITRGIEDVGAKAGYLTIVCNADRRTELEQEQLRLLTDYHAEGVIFAGSGYSRRRAGHGARGARRPGAFAGHERAVARHARLRLPARSGRQSGRRLRPDRLPDLARPPLDRVHRRAARPPHRPLSGWPGSAAMERAGLEGDTSTRATSATTWPRRGRSHARRGGASGRRDRGQRRDRDRGDHCLRQAGVAIPTSRSRG